MIKAEEARELSKINDELNEIQELIMSACAKGETSIQCRNLSEKAILYLKSFNYKITKFDNCIVYKIWW